MNTTVYTLGLYVCMRVCMYVCVYLCVCVCARSIEHGSFYFHTMIKGENIPIIFPTLRYNTICYQNVSMISNKPKFIFSVSFPLIAATQESSSSFIFDSPIKSVHTLFFTTKSTNTCKIRILDNIICISHSDNIVYLNMAANIGCLNIHGTHVTASIGCLNKHGTHGTANI